MVVANVCAQRYPTDERVERGQGTGRLAGEGLASVMPISFLRFNHL